MPLHVLRFFAQFAFFLQPWTPHSQTQSQVTAIMNGSGSSASKRPRLSRIQHFPAPQNSALLYEVGYQLSLSRALPHLRLEDVQALRSTCKAARAALGAIPPDVWLQVARCAHKLPCWRPAETQQLRLIPVLVPSNTFPPEHPLCSSMSASSIPGQASSLACLHSRLQFGESGQAGNSFTWQINDRLRGGLLATPNHQGENGIPAKIPCARSTTVPEL